MNIERSGIEIFAEAMITGNTSAVIEHSERREQSSVVRNQRLPKKANDHTVPHDIFWAGIDDNDKDYPSWWTRQRENNINWMKEQYEAMGIKIINEYDDLFYNVQLPDGWEIKATDHPMWNEIYDDQDRKRMKFFYKDSIYDRDAFTNFCLRYGVDVISEIPETSYAEQKQKGWCGVVLDHGNHDQELFCTKLIRTTDIKSFYTFQNALRETAVLWLTEHFPLWKDFTQYWKEENQNDINQ
jgi:hypothetical protein